MKFIILKKAEDVEPAKATAGPPKKGHKTYTRTVRGKVQNIKQAGIVKNTLKDKKPQAPQQAEEAKPAAAEQSQASSAKVGHNVDLADGGKAKVVSVGKDGVTAKDDKGQTHQILHKDVNISLHDEGGKPGEAQPGGIKPEEKDGDEKTAHIDKLKSHLADMKASGADAKKMKDVKSVVDKWEKEAKTQSEANISPERSKELKATLNKITAALKDLATQNKKEIPKSVKEGKKEITDLKNPKKEEPKKEEPKKEPKKG